MRVYEFCECVFVALRASCEKKQIQEDNNSHNELLLFLFSLTDASILEVNVESFSLMNAHLHFIFRIYIYFWYLFYSFFIRH